MQTFVGRNQILHRIDHRFAAGTRIVTLVGPGGVGKTRIASHYTQSDPSRWPGGVWWVDLTASRSEEDVCAALARGGALMAEGPAVRGDLRHIVGMWLAGRPRALYVLDNFEQVMAAVPSLAAFGPMAPDARFLITSRRPLGLPDEVVEEVGPLAVPRTAAGTAEIEGTEAVQLFRRLAPAQVHIDAPLAADIVRRLDGLPLAIELAAARLEVLSPEQVAERLRDRLGLLRDPTRDDADRHGRIRDTFEWSWTLLTEREQAIFSRLGVFRGSFDIEAAETVLRDPDEDPVAPVLNALVSHSLVRRDPTSERLSLLEILREFADDKLGSDRLAVEERHATHYVTRCSALADAIETPGGDEPVERLALERDNLMVVLRRALSASPLTEKSLVVALRAVLPFGKLAQMKIPAAEHLALLDETLALADRAPPSWGTTERAWVMRSRALTARLMGLVAEAEVWHRAALSAADRVGDRRLQTLVLVDLAATTQGTPAHDEVDGILEKALAIDLELGWKWHEGITRSLRGIALLDRDQPVAAREELERSLAALIEAGDLRLQGVVQGNLATVALESDQRDLARKHLEAALALHRRLGHRRNEAFALGSLGILAHLDGQVDLAESLLESAVDGMREGQDRRYEAVFAACAARVQLERGELALATERLVSALEGIKAAMDRRYEFIARCALATAHALSGNVDEAQAHRALATSDDLGSDPVRRLVEVVDAHLELARARRQDLLPDRRHGVLGAAHRALSELVDLRSDDVRTALRTLGADLKHTESQLVTWRVAEDGRSFDPPDGERVDLSTRPTLARILGVLVEARVRTPGRGLSLEELLDAGWPGERVVAGSAANRVNVALSTLRRLGLGAVVQAARPGHRLDPDTPLAVTPPEVG